MPISIAIPSCPAPAIPARASGVSAPAGGPALPRKNLQMVLIGKADAIRKIAAKYGDVTEMEIGADGFAPLVN